MSKKSSADNLFEDVLKPKQQTEQTSEQTITLSDRKTKDGQVEFTETIMVVDDSPTVLTIVCALLKRHHYNTLSFRDGKKALKALKAMNDIELAKLKAIYSDLQMPELGGMQLLEEVRREPHFADLPFVLFTSTADRGVVLKAGRLKVTGYLLKPITGDLMAESLHQLFPGRTTIRFKA